MRKDITIVSIALLIAIIVSIFLYIRFHFDYDETQPILAVPTDAGIIIQVNHPDKTRSFLFKNTSFREDLNKFETFKILSQVNEYIDSSNVFRNNNAISFLERSVLVSMHPDSQDQTNWLVNIALKNREEEREMNKLIKNFNSGGAHYKIDGSSIFELPKDKHFPLTAYATIFKGVLSFSNSQNIIEQSIVQRNKGESLLDDVTFRKIHKTTVQNNSVSIYINYLNLGKLTYSLFGSAINNPLFISRIAKWSELDVEIRHDAISLNGFTVSDEDGFFIDLFDGVTPQKSEMAQVVPSDAKFLMGYSFNANKRFKDNLMSLVVSGISGESFKKEADAFKTKTGVRFEDAFFSFIDKECALVYTEPTPSNPDGSRFLVFKTLGQSKTLENIALMVQDEVDPGEPAMWINLDDQTKFPVYRAPTSKLMQMLWGTIFPEIPATYFTFYRNFIIFANSIQELQAFIYSNVLNKTLSAHPYYSPFLENFSFHENFFLFAEIPFIFPFAQKNLNPSIFYPTNEQVQTLSKFYGVGIQLSSTNNLIYTSLHANYTPQRDKEPRTIWQSRLDSTIIGKPALVDNHNTGEKEILVQDNKNNLYLMNNMGRVLWKRPLEGPIMSEIIQIDFYKNNKLQYLFNTANRLYIIDRNGNHVAKYPITLPSPATNGLTVFDYDNNKEYRIFIALSDNRVYLFDKNGNRNPGFMPPQTEGVVSTPIQYFSTGGRDYIVFSDQYRNYILDRRGENRVIPARSFIRNPKSIFFLEGEGSDAKLVTTTQSGIVAKISLPSGECSFNQFFDSPENHFFTLIMGNTPNPLYIYVLQNQLLAFNGAGRKELEVDFNQPINIHTDIYQFSANDIKFGIVEEKSGRIHLLGRDGKNYQGFPLKGNSRFSIGFLKSSAYRFNLIVGGEHNFLNNYRIE